MRMAFEYTCISNAGKLGIVQFLYIGCTAIAHTGTQTAVSLKSAKSVHLADG